ncbi:MAG: response regulator [Planctomycetia bacterium]|nr:response regulator [Planctomycetia bacterium]
MFNERKLSILVVDDDSDIVEFMTHVLRSANYDVCSAIDGEQALQQAGANDPDIVFLDINIPEQDGWLVCSKLKMRLDGPRIVLMTGRSESDTDRFADFVHADDVLKKPFSDEDILRVVRDAATICG